MSGDAMVCLQEVSGGCLLKIHVTPRASRTEAVGFLSGELKIKVRALPADGEANDAAVKFLSDLFKVPPSSVCIRRGHSSRHKTVFVAGMGRSRAEETLSPLRA